jgi:nitroreductase
LFKKGSMRYNLSEITAIIRDRRSIYPEQFSKRKIHREQIELLLNNAIWAPSHGLTQPWRFVVLQDNALLQLSEVLGNAYLSETPKELQNDKKLIKLINRPKLATAVIALIVDREKDTKISETDDIAAVACAVQNMHLTATAQGIGGFWSSTNMVKTKQFRAFIPLTEQQVCIGLFYLGYPEIEWPKGQRKPIEYVTTWKSE